MSAVHHLGDYVPEPDEAEEFDLKDRRELLDHYEYLRTRVAVRKAVAAERQAGAIWDFVWVILLALAGMGLYAIGKYVDIEIRGL